MLSGAEQALFDEPGRRWVGRVWRGAGPRRNGAGSTWRWGLVLLAALLPCLWIAFARTGAPADGTLTYPHAPPWSARGVLLAETTPGFGDLRAGDCVVGVAGRSLEDWVTTGPPRSEGAAVTRPRVGDVLTYQVVRGGGAACRGQVVDVRVRLGHYPLASAVADNAHGLPLLVLLFVVAAFVYLRRPDDPAARGLFAVAALVPWGATAWPLGTQVIDLANGPRLWPFLVGDVANCLLWSGVLHFALVFPNPHGLLGRWPRAVVAVYAAPFLLYATVLAVALPRARGELAALSWLVPLSVPAAHTFPVLIGAGFLLGYRSARDPADRRRMRWILAAFLAAAVVYLGLGQIPDRLLGYPFLPWRWQPVLFLAFPLALAVAVLRHRLFDIEVILTRSLVYGALGALAVGAYLGTVTVAGWLFPSMPDLLGLLAVACAALAVQSLRSQLRRVVGRMIYGARDDPREVVVALGRRLGRRQSGDQVLPTVVETLARTLRLSYAAIELTNPDVAARLAADGLAPARSEATAAGGPMRAEIGRRTSMAVTVPLTHNGQELGRLVLDAGPGREPFGEADRALLETLAHQVEVTAYNILLNQRLRRSLERTVLVREEERRRIRGDIHDGLGPALAAIGMRLDVARARLAGDPEGARRLLDELADAHQQVIADVRRLVEGLRPPALDQVGLVLAIEQHARNLPRHRVEFVVEGRVGPLPAAVETAAYRICLEAMTNVLRHAEATRCTIRFDQTAGALLVDVADDGVGLPIDRRIGVGLQSIRDRAAELGGTVTITSASTSAPPSDPAYEGRSTVVHARLPLP